MKKKIITLVLAVVLCIALMISTVAYSALDLKIGTIPGTDTQYCYVDDITVQIPDSDFKITFENVCVDVALSYDDPTNAGNPEIPYYTFVLLGETGSFSFNQDTFPLVLEVSEGMNVKLNKDEKISFSGIDAETEKYWEYLDVQVYSGGTEFDSNGAYTANGEYIANVAICFGRAFDETPDNFIGDANTIDIGTLEVEKEYDIKDITNAMWMPSMTDTIQITADGEFSKFTGVKVDGEIVDSSNYTATEGSTVIEFKAEYLKTLDVGEHTVSIIFTDGEATTKIEIKENDNNSNNDNSNNDTTDNVDKNENSDNLVTDVEIPNTDGNASVAAIFVAMTFSGVALVALKKKTK